MLHPHYHQQLKSVYVARPVILHPLRLFLLPHIQVGFGHLGDIILLFKSLFCPPILLLLFQQQAFVLQTHLSTLLCECKVGLSRTLAAPSLLPDTDLGCWFKSSTDVCLTMVYYTISYCTIKCLPAGFSAG